MVSSQSIAIILVLCLWDILTGVPGQSSCGTTIGTCTRLIVIQQRIGWHTYTHYVLVYVTCDIPCINGNWGHWSAFSDTGRCSVTCCRGIAPQRRTRECNDPPPSGGGATCPGPSVETRNGVCGSDTELANQCPLPPCTSGDVAANTRFGDTCLTCVNRHYVCTSVGQPVVDFCSDTSAPGGNVWSVNLNACVTPNVCSANGGF